MPQSTKHSKTQPHDHGRQPEERRRGIEEGGRESLNESLDDGTLRGVGDEDRSVAHYTHESKSGQPAGSSGAESEARRSRLEERGGQPLNTSLEDGQLRGVDEDGQVIQGTHGGPKQHRDSTDATTLRKK